MPDQPQSEVTKPAQLGVQVSNAFLGFIITNTSNPAATPGSATASTSADSAVDAADTPGAYSENASSSPDGAGDSSNPDSLSSPSKAQAGIHGTGSNPNPAHASETPVRVIPVYHIRPTVRTA